MFTGLVQAVGVVRGVREIPGAARLIIDPADLLLASRPAPAFAAGESIAVNGTCLTLVNDPSPGVGHLEFDAVPETLRRTSLGQLTAGARVNLERSATPATLLGGHIVQGHVDGLGEVVRIDRADEWRVRIRPEPIPNANPMEYVVPKGSVTVDGVSLTVAALAGDEVGGAPSWFEVALIPATLAKTTLGDLGVGQRVNLEFDAMVKTVVHWLRYFSEGKQAR